MYKVTVLNYYWLDENTPIPKTIEVEEGKILDKLDPISDNPRQTILNIYSKQQIVKYEAIEFRTQDGNKLYDFSQPVNSDFTLVAVLKLPKAVYQDFAKSELLDAVKSNLIDVNDKLSPLSAVFDATNRIGYITIPENFSNEDLINNGILTMISDIINNKGLLSYKMTGSEKRELIKDGKAISKDEIANMILEDLEKASSIESLTSNPELIIKELAQKKALLSAELEISLGTDYENEIVKDKYKLQFVSKMNENDIQKSEKTFADNMVSAISDVHTNASPQTFECSFIDNLYTLKIMSSGLNKKGLRIGGTGFKTAMIDFLTGGKVGESGVVQENLKNVTIKYDGKKVAIDKGQLDEIVTADNAHLFALLDPFLQLFLKKGQKASKLPLGQLVGKSCTFTYTYVNDANESYTVTRTMKFEEYKENN